MKVIVNRMEPDPVNGFLVNVEGAPVTGAVLEDVIERDERAVAMNEARDFNWFPEWEKEGRNHREEKGKIVRDLEVAHWVLDVPSMEALVKLVKQYGPAAVTIQASDCPECPLRLDIMED